MELKGKRAKQCETWSRSINRCRWKNNNDHNLRHNLQESIIWMTFCRRGEAQHKNRLITIFHAAHQTANTMHAIYLLINYAQTSFFMICVRYERKMKRQWRQALNASVVHWNVTLKFIHSRRVIAETVAAGAGFIDRLASWAAVTLLLRGTSTAEAPINTIACEQRRIQCFSASNANRISRWRYVSVAKRRENIIYKQQTLWQTYL